MESSTLNIEGPNEKRTRPMGQRRLIIIAILTTLLMARLAWTAFRSREPVYQGKPLGGWLQQLEENRWPPLADNPKFKQAETAIRQIGTNAIPIYLDMIASQESSFRVKLLTKTPRQLLKKLHIQNGGEYELTLYRRRYAGAYGLIALGPDAKSAVPALITLIEDPQPSIRTTALFAVRELGPVAGDALSSLIKCLQSPEPQDQTDAVECLGTIHRDPQRVIPILLDYITQHQDPVQRAYAIEAISMFGSDAKVALPMITKFMDDKDMNLQAHALKAFYAIDQEPETILPMLLKKLHGSDSSVREISARILSDLFPEEAEKAGVYKTYPMMKQVAR
jgi:HEAT repeat protein